MKKLILLTLLCSCASNPQTTDRGTASDHPSFLKRFFAGLHEATSQPMVYQPVKRPVSCITTGGPGMYTTNCY